MSNYHGKKSMRNKYIHGNKRITSKYSHRSHASRKIKKNTGFLLQHKNRGVENDQEILLKYHINYIAQGIWKWFRNRSLPARIMLILFLLYILSRLLNMLILLVTPSLDSVYTVLGIITSTIVLYEFCIKEHKKKS